jgi:hypothetical protein
MADSRSMSVDPHPRLIELEGEGGESKFEVIEQ